MYAFLIGALITALGFTLARHDQSSDDTSGALTTLLVAGSETLRPLMSRCAEAYMSEHRDVDVVVRGGGSATGIAALLAGQIDLALSSRELTQAEKQHVERSSTRLRVRPIAREAIAVIAHRGVAIDALNVQQIAALFDGSITDWSAFGAQGGAITIVGRAAGSGTAAVIEERILDGRTMTSTARLLDTHESVIDAVGSTNGAVGYADAHLAQASASSVRIVAVSARSDEAAHLPEPEGIAQGKYPLARTLNAISIEPEAAAIDALIGRCTGTTGRSLIEAAGFLPIAQKAAVAQP